ncbi:MAG: glycine--tRNA ligase subunit beta [Proteobacteria bacterium]|nr:glycine--tRNA ligase subunit beta [Pseudomonadota bacterium]
MSDFIFEIFSEEVPAKMQKAAAENFIKIACEVFTKNNLQFTSAHVQALVTPRRLALLVGDLRFTQTLPSVKRVGPKVNADKKAIAGFLKSTGLQDESQLEQIDGSFVFVSKASEISTNEIIKNSLPQILQKMVGTWPKLMRWDDSGVKWIRPIRNILSLFDQEIIDVEFAGIKASNLSGSIEIKAAWDYKEILQENLIIVDQQKRKKKILEQIAKVTEDLDLITIDDPEKSSLFDEVNGLCEWPLVLVGSIDERFLNLPDEALILTLRNNQKYFCLNDKNGNLSTKFIFVANGSGDAKKIISDNEKLVRARLSDVEFFIQEDLKRPLISRLDELKKIIFHQKLGSVFDRVSRLKTLTKFLAVFVPNSDLNFSERAADLCKADLATKAVGELPELQGKIGSFYALKQGEDKKTIAAIYEHYLPLGPNSDLPKTALGISLSISDKIDLIVGFFLAGEKPTSSRDPYGLRRAVLGIIRISHTNNIAFPIRVLVEKSFTSYPIKLTKSLLEEGERGFFIQKKKIIEEVIIFIVERLKVYLKENEKLKADVVNTVIDQYLSDLDAHKSVDILYLAKKIKFLDEIVKDENHKNLIALYRRSVNILMIEEKKDGKTYSGKPSRLSFKTKYELALYKRVKQISGDFYKLVTKGEFSSAFQLLDILEIPLTHFFANVMVNDENKDLRDNRLLLLSSIRDLFDEMGDLSKIEIG